MTTPVISAVRAAKSSLWSSAPFSWDQLQLLANRYAPILHFHPEEPFPICSVDEYLEHAPLGGKDSFWLLSDDKARPEDLSTSKAYVHAYWIEGKTWTDLQYWFFFWGDWEELTVRVENGTEKVCGVFFSYREDGDWIEDLTQVDRGGLNKEQFIVYPSLNNHHLHPAGIGQSGRTFDCRGKIDIVSASFIPDFEEPDWLQFPYRWGKSRAHGPQSKIHWTSQLIPEFQVGSDKTGYARRPSVSQGIVSFRGQYHLFYKEEGEESFVHISSRNGIHWNQDADWDTPCPVVCKSKLNVFFKEGRAGKNGMLYIQSADVNQCEGSLASMLPAETEGQPSSTALHHILCVIGTDAESNSILRAVKSNPAGPWTAGFTGFHTTTPPIIVTFQNRFHIYFVDPVAQTLNHIYSDDGMEWESSKPYEIPFETNAGPAAVVFDNMVYVFLRNGEGNGIQTLRSIDASNFLPCPSWYVKVGCDNKPSGAVATNENGMNAVCVEHAGSNTMRSLLTYW